MSLERFVEFFLHPLLQSAHPHIRTSTNPQTHPFGNQLSFLIFESPPQPLLAMKTILLSIILSFPIAIFAQNWSPVNPNYSPQFSLEGEENIEFSIKIDSTSNGSFHLHPTYLVCDTCPTPVLDCFSEVDSLYRKQSSLLGDNVMSIDNTFFLNGPNLVLKPNDPLGSTYSFTMGNEDPVNATVTEYAEMQIFGITDSVKTFTFSNEKEIILSKNHGIISFTEVPGTTYVLSGIPELQLGNYFPGMREFYDFEIGDVFVYGGGSGWSGESYAWLSRVDITDVLVYPDSVKITYNTTTKTTTWSPDPYPTSTITSQSENNIQTVPFKNHSLQGIIPGMVSYGIDSIKMFLADTQPEETAPYLNSHFAVETEHNNRQGLSVGGVTANFETYSYMPELEYIETVYPSGVFKPAARIQCEQEDGYTNYLLDDSLISPYGHMGYCASQVEYTEGLGATCFYNNCGLAYNQAIMIGYQKGEDTFGSIFTPGEILDARQILPEGDIKIFPNPATTRITVSIPDHCTGTFNVSLNDMTGRRVLNKTGLNSNSAIDIQKLTAGTYILVGTNDKVRFTKKVVVGSGR